MNNLLKLMCIGVMFSGMSLADADGQPMVYDSDASSDAIGLNPNQYKKTPFTW